MSDAMTIAATAIRSAGNRIGASAAQIVHLTAMPAFTPVEPVGATQATSYRTVHVAMPTASLVEAMANLKQAELGFRAGVATFRAADEMTRQTLDILT